MKCIATTDVSRFLGRERLVSGCSAWAGQCFPVGLICVSVLPAGRYGLYATHTRSHARVLLLLTLSSVCLDVVLPCHCVRATLLVLSRLHYHSLPLRAVLLIPGMFRFGHVS